MYYGVWAFSGDDSVSGYDDDLAVDAVYYAYAASDEYDGGVSPVDTLDAA